MMISFRKFFIENSGAVTVDWVVLTAALVGLAIAMLGPIAFQTDSLAVQMGDYVSGVPVGNPGNR